MTTNKLWNKNFTIITAGTVISKMGNAVAGFAISLLILDDTQSVFLYAITMVLYNLPKIIMPSISGPFLDKFSRKQAIVTLDFISASLFFIITIMALFNQFSYIVILTFCVIIGSIDSIYQTAFQSLYPLLISKDNYRKAYSIEGMIGTISVISVPFAVFVYTSVGVMPLFAFNALTFLIAAILETRIRVNESQINNLSEKYNIRKYAEDFKKGLHYLTSHKGLLYITLFYIVISFAGSTSGTLMLPFFKNTPELGVWKYMFVAAAAIVGRLLGGTLHYNTKIPAAKKYLLVVIAFFAMTIFEGTYMFMLFPVMIVFMIMSGITSITTYNIRMSSTQNYVPNEIRGRFNGTFQTLTVLGGSVGGIIAGALAEYFKIPYIIVGAYVLVIIAIFAILIRGRKEIKKIYNVEFEK